MRVERVHNRESQGTSKIPQRYLKSEASVDNTGINSEGTYNS